MDDADSAAGASLIIRLSKRSEFRYPSSSRSTMPAGERSAVQMRSLFLRYGLAIGLSSVVLLVTVLAPQFAREGVYILALAAIVCAAWYGGRGPGWLATLVSALTTDYFLIHPIGTFWVVSWKEVFVLTVFVVVAIMLVEFSETRGRDHRALQASEERWKAVFENTPTMYFMVDQSGIILSVNPFGAEQLGYRVEELVGTPVLDVFHEADREAVQRHVSTCLTHVGQPMMWEFWKSPRTRLYPLIPISESYCLTKVPRRFLDIRKPR